ncbi:hypothetical protein [Bacillus wiedmannii]|uniref:Uncharacterized protein n=1 Tax=Bacillus wiedmannii TaxID=1890302 RepID=A0A2A8BP31_9BACI|nr:hypothetical protein [Bacillus wiedmannii]PEM55829.1 hypothetical protein CN611_13230 [Bacillus wiedmannii]HDR7785262.1 hypothetical protein [Bacillus wiedmannii]
MDRKTNSTWREQTLTLPPKTVYDVVFPDTKPNHYHINNLSPAMIYLGVAVIASPQSYDIAVTGNGDNIHARDLGSTRITLYNDSPDKARIVLTSFEDKFNPAVLAGRGGSVTVTGGGGGAGGVITGFNASLPSGDNNIGRVKVTEMPAIDFVLGTLPAGTNMIGKVEVSKLPPLSSIGGKIGDVGILGGVTITSMPAVDLQVSKDLNVKEKSYNDFFYQEPNVEQTEVVFTTDLSRIIFISNDGQNPLKVTLNNRTITLLQNEVIEELPLITKTIKLVRPSGSGNARIMGV